MTTRLRVGYVDVACHLRGAHARDSTAHLLRAHA